MSKLSLTHKTTRVLRFLLGLRHPQVAGLLVAHGFDANDLEEGWLLLREAVGARLDRVGPPAAPPGKIKQLDEFENKWFPIASATLQRAYPDVNEKMFLNLAQTDGPEVVVSVGTFVERIETLGTNPDGGVDPNGQAARELLERRGLTAAVMAEAKQLLTELAATATEEELASQPESEIIARQIAAEESLWSWYKEWSAISRAVIKNRNFLRQLGFLQKSTVDEEGDTPVETEEVNTSGSTSAPPAEPEGPTVPVPTDTNATTPVVNA